MEASELLKRVAGGRIPLAFDMHDSEVPSLHRPPPFYVMAPRQSYLPLVARSARESFEESAPDVGESGVWFEHDGKPLRWNIPIGVLFDYHRTNVRDDIPFKITTRFQSFPKNYLLPCSGEVDTESAFFHSMKQALCLRYGTARRLMDMPRANQETLWEGVVFAKFEKYWQPCSSLLVRDNEPNAPQLPIRVLVRANDVSLEGGARCLQSAIPLTSELTLNEAVEAVLKDNERNDDISKAKLVIQGVTPPSDAPAGEVWSQMCAHDLFLYVVAIISS